MLSAAVATFDVAGGSQLQAWLQQTGLVSSVKHWAVATGKLPETEGDVPDVVLLDLPRDPEPLLTFGAQLRRIRSSVRLIACSHFAQPDPQLLLNAMRSGVQDVLPKPIELKVLHDVLAGIMQELESARASKSGDVILIMGSKGGVGTTTIAINLGVHLAQVVKGQVALLDLARPLGLAHILLDVKPRFTLRDAVENLDRLDSHFFNGLLTSHASSLQLLAGSTYVEHWHGIQDSSLQRVINVARSGFDVTVVDLGSDFSPNWGPLLKQSLVLVVAEASVPALWSLERRLYALSGFGVSSERVRVIINRWHRSDQETLKGVEKSIKRPIFACIPNDFMRVSSATNAGAPLTGTHSNGLAAKFREMAVQLAGVTPTPKAKKAGITTLFSFGR